MGLCGFLAACVDVADVASFAAGMDLLCIRGRVMFSVRTD